MQAPATDSIMGSLPASKAGVGTAVTNAFLDGRHTGAWVSAGIDGPAPSPRR